MALHDEMKIVRLRDAGLRSLYSFSHEDVVQPERGEPRGQLRQRPL